MYGTHYYRSINITNGASIIIADENGTEGTGYLKLYAKDNITLCSTCMIEGIGAGYAGGAGGATGNNPGSNGTGPQNGTGGFSGGGGGAGAYGDGGNGSGGDLGGSGYDNFSWYIGSGGGGGEGDSGGGNPGGSGGGEHQAVFGDHRHHGRQRAAHVEGHDRRRDGCRKARRAWP